MESCIFCRIIKAKIPAAKVWEDENYLAFLSIAPINPGHTLLIPKKHIPYIFDLDNKTLSELLLKAKPVAQAMKKALNPKTGKIGIMVAGGDVPHVHIHLVPMDNESDLTFERADHNASSEKIAKNAEKIKESLEIS